jgi:hypothetical protein
MVPDIQHKVEVLVLKDLLLSKEDLHLEPHSPQ